MLEAQTMLRIAWPIPLVSYSTSGKMPGKYFQPDKQYRENPNEAWLDWLDYMQKLPEDALSSVVSINYGNDKQTVEKSHAEVICRGFQVLGSRGVTVLVSSGDAGVGANNMCESNSERGPDGNPKKKFLTAFPSSCPYITSVGGTFLFGREMTVMDTSGQFTSGEGCSDYFPRPSYQNAAVEAYAGRDQGYKRNKGVLFHPNGRAYPDIAAQSLNSSILIN
jgi:tripeptidyl-peptidase I